MQYSDPILAGLTDAVTAMIDKGHDVEAVMDGMLSLTVGWAIDKKGPREIARRLYLISLKCAADAEMLEGARSGTVN